MKFSVSRDQLLKSLNYCQGVIEKRSTLPILTNVLIEAKNSSIKITATDLDLIFINLTNNIKIYTEGSTTTSASVIYDIVRKLSSGSEINFKISNINKHNKHKPAAGEKIYRIQSVLKQFSLVKIHSAWNFIPSF